MNKEIATTHKGQIPTLNRERLLKGCLKEAKKRYSDPNVQGEFAAAANQSFLEEYLRTKPKRWK